VRTRRPGVSACCPSKVLFLSNECGGPNASKHGEGQTRETCHDHGNWKERDLASSMVKKQGKKNRSLFISSAFRILLKLLARP